MFMLPMLSVKKVRFYLINVVPLPAVKLALIKALVYPSLYN